MNQYCRTVEKAVSFLVKAGQVERCVNHVYICWGVFKRKFRPSEARFVSNASLERDKAGYREYITTRYT
jgi:hypothetical protein